MLFGIYILVSWRVEIMELAMLLGCVMSGKLHAQWRKVQDTVEETQCNMIWNWECGNAVEQYKNVLHTTSDLVGKANSKARKPWITQEMISKMDEWRKWNNVNNEEGRKNYRRLMNKLKRTTDMAKGIS